jgi:hypothetical protein
MTLVMVVKPGQGFAIRETQPSLGSFQSLRVRLLIHTENEGLLQGAR